MRTRLSLALLVLALSAACADEDPGTPPPRNQFHFPVSLAVVQPTGDVGGTLYVANSNFDLRYNRGTVVGIDLARLEAALVTPERQALPAEQRFVPLASLTDEAGVAFIGNFAGRIVAYRPDPAGPARLFVPSREDNALFPLEADGSTVYCLDAQGERVSDCADREVRLKATEEVQAQGPFGATLVDDPDPALSRLYVTHLQKTPEGQAFVVRVNPLQPFAEGAVEYLPIGPVPADDLVAVDVAGEGGSAQKTLFLTGRCVSSACTDTAPLRALTLPDATALSPRFGDATEIKESRAVAASGDGKRLFLATRGPVASGAPRGTGPDGLAIVDLGGFSAATPALAPTAFVSLPQCGTSALLHIERELPMRNLVAVACSGDNSLLFYDDALGELTAAIQNPTWPAPPVIVQPYGFALANRPGGGKRLFVANFSGESSNRDQREAEKDDEDEAIGSVAVIDLPPGGRPALRGVITTQVVQ